MIGIVIVHTSNNTTSRLTEVYFYRLFPPPPTKSSTRLLRVCFWLIIRRESFVTCSTCSSRVEWGDLSLSSSDLNSAWTVDPRQLCARHRPLFFDKYTSWNNT